ncbi:amylo-alpha-1,6-glucosidase [Pseudochryseolinea flava]|uniref:Amylo-alpha-1,6-glucosidase n=1 Tax=Pseudochryseolinea flava TaxID=2059302 RepID=A0A364XX18_9BACT|nr:amylo-alpha-1,6-glucosidase [Pseudochryseolinea flava]RAV98743.1 amylo-alpha-1,6-glucosidase [Pseudochryseolinea flava]
MSIIEIESQFYILATSSFADDRTVVLKQGDTFAILDRFGDVHPIGTGTQGIFHEDTRYISRMELSINGQRPMLLSSSPREDNQMFIVDLTNPDFQTTTGRLIQRGTLHIMRSKFLWQGACHEKIKIVNYGLEAVDFTLEMKFNADFTDIFEVRGIHRTKKGKQRTPKQDEGMLKFVYEGLDNTNRITTIQFAQPPESFSTKSASYKFHLLPRQETDIEVNVGFGKEKNVTELLGFDVARNNMNAYMEKTRQYCADVFTSNAQFNDWINRSKSDLITMATPTPHGLYPYAGVPWFSTPFGRDGIITALECLWVEPELAKGVLQYLAFTQAKSFNDFQDAEPGKIFHETRGGEMSALGEVPFEMYYGTIDATPLFVILAGAYLERTGDFALVRNIWPNIERALAWIDQYGDIDGDGFVEYKTKSEKGLTNQGWKDSQDSVFYEAGELASDPIALCEVQAYVYDAKAKAAWIAELLGLEDVAAKLKKEAEAFKEKFNQVFWSETKQTYVLALDGKKNPCNVLSSNAGHCLFSGIATPERARLVAWNLLSESMFSGWGVRTIATTEARYNPMSYHNGSIWPHDNAMIAYGFSRYNLQREVKRLLTGMFDTAVAMDDQRLPELFCGFERRKAQAPTAYPVACSPQAWSVGAVFLMLQASLGMKINALTNTITFCHPVLPDFLQEVTITNIRINDRQIILQVRKGKEGIEVNLLTPGTDVTIDLQTETMLEPV